MFSSKRNQIENVLCNLEVIFILIQFHYYVCVMYECVQVCLYTYEIWVLARGLSSLLSTLIFEIGSLTESGMYRLVG